MMRKPWHAGEPLDEVLRTGSIIFCECHEGTLPDIALEKRVGDVRLLLKHGEGSGSRRQTNVKVTAYRHASEVQGYSADACFLDYDAIRMLIARYPAGSRYVLVRLAPRASWLLAGAGLVRRLWMGQATIEGVITLSASATAQRWLVVQNVERYLSRGRRYSSVSTAVGVEGLLDYLRREGASYVVLRCYDNLPRLGREGGDLDIFVAPDDEGRVRGFLQKHPGTIGVDIWTPSSLYNGIPYLPPLLAGKVLRDAVDGPAGSRVPSLKDAFVTLAYHVLYHKGVAAGVPSSLSGIVVNTHPENDYAGMLARMAAGLGVSVDITMEGLEEYLHQEGWRPKLDTLAKIAAHNEWVDARFFRGRPMAEVGLGVLILKEKAIDRGVTESILRTIGAQKDLVVLRVHRLEEERRQFVADHLRGGVWSDRHDGSDRMLPAMMIVVLDLRRARFAKAGSARNVGSRVRNLKLRLRKAFDTDEASLIHATDNSTEAWEYLEVCFPAEAAAIRSEIERLTGGLRPTWLETCQLHLMVVWRWAVGRAGVVRQALRGRMIRWLVE